MPKIFLSSFILGALLLMGAGCASSSVSPSPSPTPVVTVPTPMSAPLNSVTYTLQDVAAHKTASDCWMAISGKVYNVTAYIPNHSGGGVITLGCGTDATQMFDAKSKHLSPQSLSLLKTFYVGDLK